MAFTSLKNTPSWVEKADLYTNHSCNPLSIHSCIHHLFHVWHHSRHWDKHSSSQHSLNTQRSPFQCHLTLHESLLFARPPLTPGVYVFKCSIYSLLFCRSQKASTVIQHWPDLSQRNNTAHRAWKCLAWRMNIIPNKTASL